MAEIGMRSGNSVPPPHPTRRSTWSCLEIAAGTKCSFLFTDRHIELLPDDSSSAGVDTRTKKQLFALSLERNPE